MVFFVIDLATRRVHVAGIHHNPDSAWMNQVALNLTDTQDGFLRGKTYLIHDRDPLSSPPLPALTLETPNAQSWYSNSTIPNRINTWTYDAVGNVLGVGGMTRTFTYDAENRQVSATVNSATATYTYDGNGLRVSKTSGGNTTVYVYDAFGYLAAEYSSQAPTSACDTNTCYAILDHLGSTRMLTDANGSSTVTRYDYLPFGQELLASTNGRTTGMGYLASADGSNPKFTGKNRDGETFLDWYEVRYMSGAQGRFQSVDPGNAGAALGNPQTWNAYSYVANNPLSYTDPSGMGFWSVLLDIASFGTKAALTFLTGGVYGIASIGSTIGAGGGNSAGAWSEQIPYNLGGGTLNTGTIYGGGDAGGGVFSVINVDKNSPSYKFYVDAIGYLMKDPGMAAIISRLDKSSRNYYVDFITTPGDGFDHWNTVYWNPTSSLRPTSGGCMSPALALGHELAHADGWGLGYFGRLLTPEKKYDNAEEKRVIEGPEAAVAKTLGEPRRYNHQGEVRYERRGSTSKDCYYPSNVQ